MARGRKKKGETPPKESVEKNKQQKEDVPIEESGKRGEDVELPTETVTTPISNSKLSKKKELVNQELLSNSSGNATIDIQQQQIIPEKLDGAKLSKDDKQKKTRSTQKPAKKIEQHELVAIPTKKKVSRKIETEFKSPVKKRSKFVNERDQQLSDSSSESSSSDEDGQTSPEESDAECDGIEMEVSVLATDDEFSGAEDSLDSEDLDLTDQEDLDYDSDSDSEIEKQRGLSRRLAISKMENRGQKGQSSKSKDKTSKRSDESDSDLKNWIKGVVDELKELREIAKTKAEDKKAKKDKKKQKKEEKRRRRDKKMQKYKKKGNELPIDKLNVNSNQEQIKPIISPSVGTLYRPGVQKLGTIDRSVIKARQQLNLIDQISNFVEKLRVEDDKKRKRKESSKRDRESEEVLDAAERAIVTAEKNKAELEIPRGKEDLIFPSQSIEMGKVPCVDFTVSDQDGDFFNINCHIDDNLKEKIERGEYVALEKLLFKLRQSLRGPEDEEDKIEVIKKNGLSYRIPTSNEKEEKIYSLKNGRKHSGCTHRFTQQPTPTEDMRYGNTFTTFTQHQFLSIGTM